MLGGGRNWSDTKRYVMLSETFKMVTPCFPFNAFLRFPAKKIVGTIVPVFERTTDQFSPLFMEKALFVIKKFTFKFI